jgi:signal transduction histidine kinase
MPSASGSLRVLVLEDVQADAALIERELRTVVPGAVLQQVASRGAFLNALREFNADLVLSDYVLPGFGGMEALAAVRAMSSDLPFIFVTGSLDEETAAACIKAGASDYLLKQHLARLGPAVRAALELKRTRDALRRSQQQLLHAQKLEAVGRLAGGVAHDFNNITTTILGYCELLAGEMAPEDPRRADLVEIRRAADRAAGLTRQLLAFSRKQVMVLQPVRLNDIVTDMDRMLRRLIGEDIELVTRLAEDAGWVQADPGQIEQVIVNLAVNSRDAMPDGGKLTIETQNVTFDASAHADLEPGPHVMLAVSDTGIGIDAETRSRMFEPFFTTKGPGKGTGLGLAMVYGIVRQSGGSIYVYSEPEQGATFKIYLREITPPQEGRPRASQPIRALDGSETILLAEDEEGVRALARKVLQSHGYVVLDAADGPGALARAAAHAERIDLLLTDVIMPGLSGRHLAERVLTARPGIRVVFMSGYTDDAIVRHGVLAAGVAYVQKPFTPEGLLRKVREVLDAQL